MFANIDRIEFEKLNGKQRPVTICDFPPRNFWPFFDEQSVEGWVFPVNESCFFLVSASIPALTGTCDPAVELED